LKPTERRIFTVKTLANATGFRLGKAQHGAFIRDDNGMSYWSVMVGRGWSAALPMPDEFRTQRDVNSTSTAYNIRITAGQASAARLQGTYRQEWCEKRGPMSFRELMAKCSVSDKDAAAILSYYGLDL
jgi:hypothetical protein